MNPTFKEACFLVQCMIAARSRETSVEAQGLRRSIATKLEAVYPGIIAHNRGEILLK